MHSNSSLYPLKFDPIYQYRIWGGQRLSEWLSRPLPENENIGEAWILSDREENPSRVAEGFLKGKTIAELMKEFPADLMGKAKDRYDKFPLLLKFLDAQTVLSVQVHPSDEMKDLLPAGESGKTEAWVVLEANEKSRIYAGLKPGTSKEELIKAIETKKAVDFLPHFQPQIGDAIYIPAGTVHTFDNVLLFEVQENSDITYRLYDWDRIDEKTGMAREIQVDKALECIDFSQGQVMPITPEAIQDLSLSREKLFDCDHFVLWRLQSDTPFSVGEDDLPRVIVCIEGYGRLKAGGSHYSLNRGDVMLLPASSGKSTFLPDTKTTLFEIALPE